MVVKPSPPSAYCVILNCSNLRHPRAGGDPTPDVFTRWFGNETYVASMVLPGKRRRTLALKML